MVKMILVLIAFLNGNAWAQEAESPLLKNPMTVKDAKAKCKDQGLKEKDLVKCIEELMKSHSQKTK